MPSMQNSSLFAFLDLPEKHVVLCAIFDHSLEKMPTLVTDSVSTLRQGIKSIHNAMSEALGFGR